MSQDFNAIENVWKELRDRLFGTAPSHLEKRDEFVVRLLREVAWLNRTRQSQLQFLSTNQKKRCRDCLQSEPPGGRTKW